MARRVPLGAPGIPMIFATALAMLPRPILAAALVQALAGAGPRTGPGPVSARDSARLVRRAHAAQSDFENYHRYHLPIGYGGYRSAPCDAVVGRFYYCSDDGSEGDDSVPTESPKVVRARTRLLATLDSIGALVPGDAWIAGERVRYRLDASDTAAAVSAARSCGASVWWCAALTGLALHEDGDFAAADSAFDAALAEMPEAQRCRWTDLSLLLDGPLADRYHERRCAQRDSLARRIWWLSAPLYLVGAHDLRTEMLSRVTRAEIDAHADGMQGSWGDDMRELMLRYGWDTWYSRIPPDMGSALPEIVVGHESSPSFDFVPTAIAVDSPFTSGADRYDLKLRTARMRYAPSYLRSMDTLAHQLAVFRRGDSALVVAAFDVREDTTLAGRALSSGLFLWTGPSDGTRAVRDDSASRQVLTATAPWQPLVIGLEVLARKERRAARVRIGRALAPVPGGVSLSDLLLYTPSDSAPHRLADVLAAVLPTSRVHRRQPLGVYWETYGLARAGEDDGVSLTIARVGGGWFRRAAELLRVAHRGTPLSVRWRETPDAASGIAARGVAIDLARLPTGLYRITLTVTVRGRPPAVVTREIELVD